MKHFWGLGDIDKHMNSLLSKWRRNTSTNAFKYLIIMGCLFRGRLNQLASVWYTGLSVLLQAYLLYLGFERYRLYAAMKWPQGAYPQTWLTVYIALLAVCIPLLVLFAASGLFKSGNLAGDNEQLGMRAERIFELIRGPTTSANAAQKRRRSIGKCLLCCLKK